MWSHIIATMLFSWVEFQLKKGIFFILLAFFAGFIKMQAIFDLSQIHLSMSKTKK